MTPKEQQAKEALERTIEYIEDCQDSGVHPIVIMLGSSERSLVFQGEHLYDVQTSALCKALNDMGFEVKGFESDTVEVNVEGSHDN